MASIYPHKFGWRITYRLYFLDNTNKIKSKYSKLKAKARMMYRDIERLEALIDSNRIMNEDLRYAINQKYISSEKAHKLNSNNILILNDPSWKPAKDYPTLKKGDELLEHPIWLRLFSECRKRALRKKNDMNISFFDFKNIIKRSNGCCEITGIQFNLETKNSHKGLWEPFHPSIDRINNGLGYSKENIRLVCVAVNVALHQWGLQIFDYIVQKRSEYFKNFE